jgi:hypothetical protein
MVCFRLSKKNFLKLTFSLLTAFIILLGGIGHADASYYAYLESAIYPNYSQPSYDPCSVISASSTSMSDLGDYLASSTFFYQKATSTTVYSNEGSCYAGVCTGFSYMLSGYEHTAINSYSWTSNRSDFAQEAWGRLNYLCVSPTAISCENSTASSCSLIDLPDVLGCMDNMAVNYDPNANVDSGGCYYVLPTETATSTRIISFTFSTTTNTIDLSYYVATSSPVDLYVENRNERDGVINSAFSTTTTGLVELNNIPVTLPNPLNGAGYTYLTTKLVLASDHSIIYDWHTLTVDLYNGVDLGGGGYQQEECGITHLGGCFMNGLAVMFYPSQNAFNQFNNFVELIKTKPPVGYFYVVKNNLDNLSSTSTSAFTVTIPSHIKEYLFTPFDVGIGGILWFFFAINFYKRLKHITV